MGHIKGMLPQSVRAGDVLASRNDLGAIEIQLERRMELLRQENDFQNEHLSAESHAIRTLVNEAQQNVMDTAMCHTEELVGEVRGFLEEQLQIVRRNVDSVRRNVEAKPAAVPSERMQNPITEQQMIDDALYVSLEDHFRGDKETIRTRQLGYLDLVRDVASASHPVLDLGCGRGEWLSILDEQGVPALGVDGNVVCVAECTEAGLDARLGDLVSFLSNAPDASFGAITMFQVLEHLPFPTVVHVLREARRVLVNGGCFIGEVPNAETLKVSAGTFWIDPTHNRPLYPALLLFLAREVGFASVESHYSSPIGPDPDLAGLPENLRQVLTDLHQSINGPGDFALVARA
jgi:O-antigen chain-terminating methyltransferase